MSRQSRTGPVVPSSANASSPASLRQEDEGSSSSSSTSSSTSADRQSLSIVGTGFACVGKLESSSSSTTGVSSKLPNAGGCAAELIFRSCGRDGISSANDSLCIDAGTPGAVASGACAIAGAENSAWAGAAVFVVLAAVRETPARSSADFTIEIRGSGGTNGFFSTPSAPTRCASCSSSGSNAPTNKITGICESEESDLTYWQTS